jgi:transposase-like protein
MGNGTFTRFEEALKMRVVEEIESGRLSISEAGREYGAAKGAIKYWLEEYGRFKPKRSVVEVVMKSEKERISELEKALADAHLKMRIYDEIINLAGKKYKVDLKKTFGTPQPEASAEKDGKSKPRAKCSE